MDKHDQAVCKGFINTSALWNLTQFEIQQFDFPALDLSDFKPKPIPKNIRLGHQMEDVFLQLILYSKKYEVLVHNLPIKDGNRTIGEIDFILKDVITKQLIHVELTYKFYIIVTEISEPVQQLIGPNKRDAFFAKMEKIKNKQFKLLHSNEGVTTLKSNNIEISMISHQVYYKAQLFVPFHSKNTDITPLNKDCIVGYWLKFEAFKSEAFYAYQFYMPSKKEWVITPHDKVVWISHVEICTAINERMLDENAPMVWIKKSASDFEKFFVLWW